MKILNLNIDERPREKLALKGPESLSNSELLGILLRSGTEKINAMDVARILLSAADNSLTTLSSFSIEKMSEVKGIGKMKAITICAAFELGRRFSTEKTVTDKVSIRDSSMIWKIMQPLLRGLQYEECWVLWLNRANYIIGKEKLSKGGMSATIVDIKLIISKTLEKKASGIILVHNHPSGNPKPGDADIRQTEALKKALTTFDISFLDHIIVCDDRYFSFADNRVEISD